VEPGIVQACLYPSNAQACGMLGLIPGVGDLVPYVPALLAERHSSQYGIPSWITGIVKRIDSSALAEAGFTTEDQEVIRQSGDIWFLDATNDDSRLYSIAESEPTQLWGGLYASGHLEVVSGSLAVASLVSAFEAALAVEGFPSKVSQNQAGRREIVLYAKGLRVTLDSQIPFYSLHMDAELSQDFASYRTKFDRVTNIALANIAHACASTSVVLSNPLDVDFTYTNSSSLYSVLKSAGASAISDPLAMAIRDWHRRRSDR